MSKQILLVRHAQTAGKQAGQRDYDRVLTPEGELQARGLGQLLVRNSIQPDVLISSSALRARQTAHLLNESTLLPPSQLLFLDTLYEADGDTWMTELRRLSDSFATVICVGHNPTLSWLAGHLARRPIDLVPAGRILFRSPSLSWSAAVDDLGEAKLTDL